MKTKTRFDLGNRVRVRAVQVRDRTQDVAWKSERLVEPGLVGVICGRRLQWTGTVRRYGYEDEGGNEFCATSHRMVWLVALSLRRMVRVVDEDVEAQA